jgi:hypothetical protein
MVGRRGNLNHTDFVRSEIASLRPVHHAVDGFTRNDINMSFSTG